MQLVGAKTELIRADGDQLVADIQICRGYAIDAPRPNQNAQLIREMLAEGKTETEIRQYFVSRFGDRVLAAPPARGLNWLVYVIPPVAILAGVLILFSALRAWRQAPSVNPASKEPSTQATTTENDEYTQRLEEELRKL